MYIARIRVKGAGAWIVSVLTWQHAFHGQGDRQRRHQCLVGGRIEYGAQYGTHVKPSSNPAIQLYADHRS